MKRSLPPDLRHLKTRRAREPPSTVWGPLGVMSRGGLTMILRRLGAALQDHRWRSLYMNSLVGARNVHRLRVAGAVVSVGDRDCIQDQIG